MIVSANLATFGEQWSLPIDDCGCGVLHEVAHHTILGVPHIGESLSSMLACGRLHG